ncbi:uncharacterized protein VTP21DRAFT_5857 [Calcarisporiella thermophila]|uniref:uncharacterized protein n=1 Tax=Calcarisporiella thermophila TaxID=911321 RepID=UPI0037436609
MSSNSSYYLRKRAFIESQLQIFQKPFNPPIPDELPEPVVSAVIHKINVANRKAYRQTFSHQAVHQLLQQLHQVRVEEKRRHRDGIENIGKADIGSRIWMESFPRRWTGDDDEEDIERYDALRARVQSLQYTYLSVKAKHDRYKEIYTSLSALKPEAIRCNIIATNSPVIQELERTRRLLARLLPKLRANKAVLIEKQLITTNERELERERIERERRARGEMTQDVILEFFKR